LEEFKASLQSKYADSTTRKVMSYVRRFSHILWSGNLSEINALPETIRTDAVKALIILSKYLGLHEEFKAALKAYGIKLKRPDALAAFIRIYSNNNADLGEWLESVRPVLRPRERILLRFLKLSGLRTSEGIAAFNLIIELSKQDRLSEYLNNGFLEHFRYRDFFLRGTKNAYISIVPAGLIAQIAESKSVSYSAIIKRLYRNGLKSRISELRDQFGTFVVQHGLVAQEADLLCGRIPPSIFVRHYFSPRIAELKARTLKALRDMKGGD
jgi:intergrase/recombinase